jgi:carbamoyltransferase
MSKAIVGLGGLLSDPACCVLRNGHIASAVEQSKVSRQDRPGEFPDEAFHLALDVAGVSLKDIDCVAIARPFAAASESLAQLQLRARFPKSEIVVVEHHHAHAASAYYTSPFETAHVLSADRAGDYRSAVLFQAQGNQLTPVRELYFPDSLGYRSSRVRASRRRAQSAMAVRFGTTDLFACISENSGPSRFGMASIQSRLLRLRSANARWLQPAILRGVRD